MTRKVADVKCPKCGSKTFTLMDFTLMSNERYVENGVWDNDTQINPCEMTGKVLANCHNESCKHTWRLRNVEQVTDFEEITE